MLVETGVFFEDTEDDDATYKAVRKYFPNAEKITSEKIFLSSDIKVGFFRGSHGLASKMKQTFSFTNAINWLPNFKHYAFAGKNYHFIDFEQAVHNAQVFGLGENGTFIRPTAGLKEFSGQVFRGHCKLENEFHFVTKNKNLSPHLLCLVSPAVKIYQEYRCIFVNNKFVSGAMYCENGERKDGPIVVQAVSFAEKLAQDDYFQNIFDFVIDVGWGDEGLKLIEINGFETASFYTADLDKIYSAWAQSLNNYVYKFTRNYK